MQKTPTYLGIFATDPKAAHKAIHQYCVECIQEISKKFPDNKQIQSDKEKFRQIFIPPGDNLHITCLFIGGKPQKLKQKEKEIYGSWKNGQQVCILIEEFVYVPGYLICAYSPDTTGIQVANKYPHCTLYVSKDAKPVQSNDVIDLVYSNKKKAQQNQIQVVQVEYKKHKEIYTMKKQIKIEGVTGPNFGQKRKY